MSEAYDAVVVGARCAGAPLAQLLAAAGWDVLLLDRHGIDREPVTTHVIFPPTLDALDRLGVLARLEARHRINPLGQHLRLGRLEISRALQRVGRHEHAAAPRRRALDAAMVEAAAAAGAEVRLGTGVVGLLGAGTDDDPVTGVRLADGTTVRAGLVAGADGRTSTVARLLGVEKRRERRGDMSLLLAYWRGLPDVDRLLTDVDGTHGMAWIRCEDDVHLLSLFGRADFARGAPLVRERRYAEALRRFPGTIDPAWLDAAERISPVRAAPESMLRGYFRQATGPGWVLLGDAGHVKHAAIGQGMADAVEDALYVGGALARGDGLDGFEAWRDERALGPYEESFRHAVWPADGETSKAPLRG